MSRKVDECKPLNYGSDTPNLHAQLLPLALFAVVCYPFGIMFLFVTIFWRHRVVLKQRSRLNALGPSAGGGAPGGEDAALVEELRQCERRFGFLFRSGAPDVARHIKGCRITQDTRLQARAITRGPGRKPGASLYT